MSLVFFGFLLAGLASVLYKLWKFVKDEHDAEVRIQNKVFEEWKLGIEKDTSDTLSESFDEVTDTKK